MGVVTGETLTFGRSDVLPLERLAADGSSLPALVMERPERRVGRDQVESVRRSLIDEVRAVAERRAAVVGGGLGPSVDFSSDQVERLEKVEAYGTLPAFRSMVAAGPSTVWVEDYPAHVGQPSRWYRIEGGAVTGWIEVQAGAEVLAIGHGLIVTRIADEFGVETIIVGGVATGGE